MLFVTKYDPSSLAALTYEKDRRYFDTLVGKVITVGLDCGTFHTGALVEALSDGIKLFSLYPPTKRRSPYQNCTYEYIFYRGISFVITSF